jgi:hypothetical protein
LQKVGLVDSLKVQGVECIAHLYIHHALKQYIKNICTKHTLQIVPLFDTHTHTHTHTHKHTYLHTPMHQKEAHPAIMYAQNRAFNRYDKLLRCQNTEVYLPTNFYCYCHCHFDSTKNCNQLIRERNQSLLLSECQIH